MRYVWDRQNVLRELDSSNGLLAHYTDSPSKWGGLSSVFLPGGSSLDIAAASFDSVQFDATQFNQTGGGSSSMANH